MFFRLQILNFTVTKQNSRNWYSQIFLGKYYKVNTHTISNLYIIFLWKNPMAEKECENQTWFLMGVTTPCSLQSKLTGTSTSGMVARSMEEVAGFMWGWKPSIRRNSCSEEIWSVIRTLHIENLRLCNEGNNFEGEELWDEGNIFQTNYLRGKKYIQGFLAVTYGKF